MILEQSIQQQHSIFFPPPAMRSTPPPSTPYDLDEQGSDPTTPVTTVEESCWITPTAMRVEQTDAEMLSAEDYQEVVQWIEEALQEEIRLEGEEEGDDDRTMATPHSRPSHQRLLPCYFWSSSEEKILEQYNRMKSMEEEEIDEVAKYYFDNDLLPGRLHHQEWMLLRRMIESLVAG